MFEAKKLAMSPDVLDGREYSPDTSGAVIDGNDDPAVPGRRAKRRAEEIDAHTLEGMVRGQYMVKQAGSRGLGCFRCWQDSHELTYFCTVVYMCGQK